MKNDGNSKTVEPEDTQSSGKVAKLDSDRQGFEAELRTPRIFRKRIKRLLGQLLPASYTFKLIAHWADLRVWRKTRLTATTPTYSNRYALYSALISKEIPSTFAYLEFGCASGEVVRWWANAVPDADSRFWGFDTFTGMPEEWRGLGWRVKKGTWSQNGKLPEKSDPRADYVAGRFQDSLPGFLEESQIINRFDHFVIHIDADLYSATLYVLTMLHPIMRKATILFDEFDCQLDEMKALEDYCRSYCVDYEVLGTADECEKVAIRFKNSEVDA